MIKTYRKKPVEIQAIQLLNDDESIWGAANFVLERTPTVDKDELIECVKMRGGLSITTLEGTMTASFGDYIIKDVAGGFYPCKAHIFAETYDEVFVPIEREKRRPETFDEMLKLVTNSWALYRKGEPCQLKVVGKDYVDWMFQPIWSKWTNDRWQNDPEWCFMETFDICTAFPNALSPHK